MRENNFEVLPLYRFFASKERADQFANGEIWISTLAECRKHEDFHQGDADEGSNTFHISSFESGTTEQEIESKILNRLRFDTNGAKIIMKDCKSKTSIKNAFLLCTTKNKDIENLSDKWKYGVQINTTSKKLNFLLNASLIFNNKVPVVSNLYGITNYNISRDFSDINNPPPHSAFLKPQIHASQEEYRFYWECPRNYEYKNGILVKCESLKKYLKKLY